MFEEIEILHFIIKRVLVSLFFNSCLYKLRVKTSTKAPQIRALTIHINKQAEEFRIKEK